MTKRGIAALIAAGLLVAGCGSSSKGTSAPPTTTKPPVAASTPKQLAADKALAKRAVLALTDFPLGYTSKPHDNSSSNNAVPPGVERKFVSCSHFPKRFLDNTGDNQPNADSPDFSKGVIGREPAAEIQSSVEIDRSVKDISAPLSLLAAPGVVKCFDPLFRAIFAQSLKGESGVTLTDFTFTGLSVGTVGDQGAGFQGRVTIAGPKASLPIEFNFYFVRAGRSIIVMSAVAFSVPFPQDFAQSLLEKMVGRLRAGLGATQ